MSSCDQRSWFLGAVISRSAGHSASPFILHLPVPSTVPPAPSSPSSRNHSGTAPGSGKTSGQRWKPAPEIQLRHRGGGREGEREGGRERGGGEGREGKKEGEKGGAHRGRRAGRCPPPRAPARCPPRAGEAGEPRRWRRRLPARGACAKPAFLKKKKKNTLSFIFIYLSISLLKKKKIAPVGATPSPFPSERRRSALPSPERGGGGGGSGSPGRNKAPPPAPPAERRGGEWRARAAGTARRGGARRRRLPRRGHVPAGPPLWGAAGARGSLGGAGAGERRLNGGQLCSAGPGRGRAPVPAETIALSPASMALRSLFQSAGLSAPGSAGISPPAPPPRRRFPPGFLLLFAFATLW